MNKLIRFFIERSFIVNIISVFVLLLGVFAITSMKRDLVPSLSMQQVQVEVSILGASPEEMERHVTFPLEQALQSMVGVDYITSRSSLGQSSISLIYKSNFNDMDEALSLVQSRISSIRYKLPQEVRNIVVERARNTDVFLSFMGVKGFHEDNSEHRNFLRKFEKAVLAISGVVKFNSYIRERDIYVNFNAEQLAAKEISIIAAKNSLRDSIRISPLGIYKEVGRETGVQIAKTISNIEDIKNLTLSSNLSGQTVKLKDVADVHYDLSKEFDKFYLDGLPAASFVVKKALDTDIIDIKNAFNKVLNNYNKIAPKGLEIVYLVDGPRFIEQQLDLMSKNSLLGLLIVLSVLMLFLNWRTALMTAFGIPLSYAGTLVILHFMGINFDLLSIIGIILVLGILVDDAIIVAEKYTDLLQQGRTPRQAAEEAVKRLILPVTGTVLTTIVAFTPLIFIKSEMSTFLIAVPIIVIFSLTISWAESFFILPNHLVHFVRKGTTTYQDQLFAKIKQAYECILKVSLKWRYLVLFGFLSLTALAGYIAVKKVEHNFDIRINKEKIVIFAELKNAKDLNDARSKLEGIEDFLLTLDKNLVDHSTTGIGYFWSHGKLLEGLQYAKLQIYMSNNSLYPERDRKILLPKVEKFVNNFKTKTGYFKKLQVKAEKQGDDEIRSGLISVSIKGDDEVEFFKIEKEISDKIVKLDSISKYLEDKKRIQETWKFFPDQESLARYGLNSFQISTQIRGQFTPDEIAELRINGENTFIYADVKRKENLSPNKLKDLKVTSSRGIAVPLKMLGQWKSTHSLKTIEHRDSLRNLTMDFVFNKDNNGKINISEAQNQVREALKPVQENFLNYDIEVKDGNEQETKNKIWAMKVAMVCIAGVIFIMALILGSIIQPLIVCLPIPFGLVGIVFALYFHNMPLGIMALIGLIGTVGVAVNDSIVMMDEINSQRDLKGKLDRNVIISGASSRLRAILLTTITTLGGVFPMAYSIGGESGFTQPLAFSMGWGLSFATILTLFILPSLLMVYLDIVNLFRKVLFRHPSSITIHPVGATEGIMPQTFVDEDGFQAPKNTPPPSPSL